MSGCPMGGKCRPVCVQFKPLVVACYKCARIITDARRRRKAA